MKTLLELNVLVDLLLSIGHATQNRLTRCFSAVAELLVLMITYSSVMTELVQYTEKMFLYSNMAPVFKF